MRRKVIGIVLGALVLASTPAGATLGPVGWWKFDDGSGTNVNMFLTPRMGTNAQMRFAITSGANGPEYDDGKPHLMVGTIDGKSITLYIDGVRTAGAPLSATNTISGISQNLAYLAKGGYSADPEWIGAIDEFRIYDRALSAGEIRYLAGGH